MEKISIRIARRLSLPVKGVEGVIGLLEEGATVPFISRYRKEATGALDEVQVRDIETTLRQIRDVDERREAVKRSISESGNLTDDLSARLDKAETLTDIEDIYAPYKPKKRTRATIAREKGLEPLAKQIMAGRMPKASEEDLEGASDIIAEWASESVRLRNMVRRTMRRAGRVVSKVVKGKEGELGESQLAQYADFNKDIRRMASHQYLALKRAEREGLIRVKYDLGDEEKNLRESLIEAYMPRNATAQTAPVVADAVADAFKRLLLPSVENEISAELKEMADKVAIDIFAGNLRDLLLASPLKDKRILAIDPGYRTGCKVVALDRQGALLADTVIYPTAPRNDTDGATKTIEKFIKEYAVEAVAIGNGTASRETERFVKQSG
ncbi:MAG: RNA-binding transcriptional accessory protein, partial [Muribaculaceae bacterium]|nr:RNA-binding transcriptional accessory protein [Muribaculaceae bacterium]